MLIFKIHVDAPGGAAQAIKEHLAMVLERFGDVRVISVEERAPEQMRIPGMSHGTYIPKNDTRRKYR